MFLEEPRISFVELELSDIAANTGAGYTICQKVTGTNVNCEGMTAQSNITYDEACRYNCDKTSDFNNPNYDVFDF